MQSFHRLNILSCNTNGLKHNGAKLIEKYIQHYHCTGLQETKLGGLEQESTFRFHLDNTLGPHKYRLFVDDTNTNTQLGTPHRQHGIATLFHHTFPGFSTLQRLERHTIPNRYHVIQTTWETTPVYIHNIYAPAKAEERPDFYQQLPTTFPADALHIALGDFNLPLEESLDSSQGHPHHNSGKQELVLWLAQLQMVDPWRLHHPSLKEYSSPTRLNRIDYIFCSELLTQYTYKSSKYTDPPAHTAGDHKIVSLQLQSSKEYTSRPYWTLPTRLLHNPTIKSYIQKEAQLLADTITTSNKPDRVWHGWKKRIQKKLQMVQARLAQGRNQEVIKLTADFNESSTLHKENQITDEQLELAKTHYTTSLEQLTQQDDDSTFDFTSKNMEQSSSYFFRKPKETLYKIPITQVQLPNGQLTTNAVDISYEFQKHWGTIMGDDKLSDSPLSDIPNTRSSNDFISTNVKRTLTDDAQQYLDQPLRPSDLADAIQHMDPNTAPGPDGFTTAFYQLAPTSFSKILKAVFDKRQHTGYLMPYQRNAATTLLFKAGSRANPANYRPIALIPVEVKILSKALAFKLSHVLPHLIHPHQTGFVKGRNIHDHLHFIRDLQHHCTTNDHNYYATFLDFEKAFDRVNWSYLWKVMKAMNFGPRFLQWVQLLYKNPSIQLILNNTLTPPIYPSRGVRQGDPLSSQLFLLSIEPLGEMLRNYPMGGIPITDDHHATCLLFADDTTLLSESLPSLEAQLELVETYCKASGAQLNRNKSKTLPLNRSNPPTEFPNLTIVQPDATVKYLGLHFGQRFTNDQQLQILNDKFMKGFLTWYKRARTIQGRKLIVHTQCLSLLWHTTPTTTITPQYVAQWQSMVNKFVLGRRYTPQQKYTALLSYSIAHDKTTGLSIPKIQNTLHKQRLSTLQRLVTEHDPATLNWTTLPLKTFQQALSATADPHTNTFLYTQPHPNTELQQHSHIPPFWIDSWNTWYKLAWKSPQLPWSREALLKSPLWLSAHPDLQTRMRNGKTQPLAYTLFKHRAWLLWCIDSNNIYCLQNILDQFTTWPTYPIFKARIEIVSLLHPWPHTHSHKIAYTHLTAIFQHVLATTPPNPQQQRHKPFTFATTQTPVTFPHVKASMLKHIYKDSSKQPHPRHPFEHWSIDKANIPNHLKEIRLLRQHQSPLTFDTYLRISFRIVPVQSRFWFAETSDPTIQQCPNNCNQIETEEHAFFTCPRITNVWSELLPPWTALGYKPSWFGIMQASRPQNPSPFRIHTELLHKMWFALVCNTLYLIWKHRCNTKFRQRSPPDNAALIETSLKHWCAQLRSWMRQPEFQTELNNLQTIAQHIFSHTKYQWFQQKHPNHLHIKKPPDIAKILQDA